MDGFLAPLLKLPWALSGSEAACSKAGASPAMLNFGGVSRRPRPPSVFCLRAAADGPAAPTEFKLDTPVAELIGDCKSLGLVRFVTVSWPGFSAVASANLGRGVRTEAEGGDEMGHPIQYSEHLTLRTPHRSTRMAWFSRAHREPLSYPNAWPVADPTPLNHHHHPAGT